MRTNAFRYVNACRRKDLEWHCDTPATRTNGENRTEILCSPKLNSIWMCIVLTPVRCFCVQMSENARKQGRPFVINGPQVQYMDKAGRQDDCASENPKYRNPATPAQNENTKGQLKGTQLSKKQMMNSISPLWMEGKVDWSVLQDRYN